MITTSARYGRRCGEPPFSFTLLRFTLYTAIGLGSWLGGAFVERLLECVLSQEADAKTWKRWRPGEESNPRPAA